jgi:hypothetical protein
MAPSRPTPKAPRITRSPWATWTTSIMPKMRVRPLATRARMRPIRPRPERPRRRSGTRLSNRLLHEPLTGSGGREAPVKIIESKGAQVPGRSRMHTDPFTNLQSPISATAATPQSLRTAIRADIGESEGYKAALQRGEIGLQRPMGANVPGVDFITAPSDGSEIIVTDVKRARSGDSPRRRIRFRAPGIPRSTRPSRGYRWKTPRSRAGSGPHTGRSGCVSDSSVRTTRPKAKAR